MPTGVSLRDPRAQLFDAAERVLLRSGPHALTSRAVTAEAGCAKGVLHKHFADVDAFLAELVVDRGARVRAQGEDLRATAGTGSVPGHLAGFLTELFGPVALAVVGLVTLRDGLRARLRETWPTGMPLLSDATAALAGYLVAERDLGRLTADADARALALSLVGAGHLLFAGRLPGTSPEPAEVDEMVASVVGGALSPPRG